ncbi:MAG: PKD domain-containing protein, partial [Kiritimatiellae bacterium]|nr:PKD domain-containing protein [Kiritimatiellia bacterium]
MNRIGFKEMFKSWALPAAVCCALLSGGTSNAQTAGDIVSIYSDQANTTYTSSGTDIDIKIRLWGDFRRHSIGGTEALLPQLRLVINGDIAWATLFTLNRGDFGGIYKTEAVFRYRARPGDMAQPMKIFGSSGSGMLPGNAFEFYWNGWEIRNETTTSNAVWRYNPGLMGVGDILDEDFSKAKVVLRTLAFDNVLSPNTVAATESVNWRVTTVNPVEAGNVVDFYVWSPSNNVRLGTSPGDPLLVSMPQGTTEIDFPVFGVSPGVAEIFLQRTKDYQNNGSVGVTNFIKRTITVTAAPDPTVSIRMKSSGTDIATLSETDTFNAGSLYVDLSQSYTGPMTVRLDLSNLQAGETNLSFFASPIYVDIPAGATSSSEVFFNVPDGTVWSAGAGIVVTPVITNAAAAAVYTRTRTGRVYVQNTVPAIINPLSTDEITVTRGEPHPFNWMVNDVLADRQSGMTVEWIFGDGTTTNVSGSTGTVLKSYASNGTKVVKVKATDKDNGISAEIQFTVIVVAPEPKPSVRVVPEFYEYGETNVNNTGRFHVYLSDSISEDTFVRFDTVPVGQTNLLLSSTGIKISAGTTQTVTQIRFSLKDGTQDTESFGVEIMPVVTNAAAASHYTDMQSATIYVNNQPPQITMPSGGVELGPIPSGVPYDFNYSVNDVAADLDTMLVHWRFTEGGPLTTVTGAVGSVSHTYLVQGTHRVRVQAEDKDGGFSDEIEFTVVVGPPPTVEVIAPGNEISETAAGTPEQVIVRLSTPFAEAVTVNLGVTPATSPLNGELNLTAYTVTIPAGELEGSVEIDYSSIDGTVISRNTGFKITPTVNATASAQAFYTVLRPGYVRIRNENPFFLSTTTSSEAVVSSAKIFTWAVNDATADKPTLQVTWIWGDGEEDTYTGANGSVTHTYTSAGPNNVQIVVRDKDGGIVDRQIIITVRAAKALNVTPVGPNPAGYYGAGTVGRLSVTELNNTGGGIGYGTVIPRQTMPSGSDNYSDVYYFRYPAGASTASLEASPYKTDISGTYFVTSYNSDGVPNPTAIGPLRHDSFFLCWEGGTDQGLAEEDLSPATAANVANVALPNIAADGATDAEIRKIRAIFSLEWIQSDNVGDINKDGIPDDTAMYILSKIAANTDDGGNEGGTPSWLQRLDNFNDDLDKEEGGTPVGDFYPENPLGVDGTFDFRPTGEPFIAFAEVRGKHEGLNRLKGSLMISDEREPLDEPGTSPVLADSDGDGMPDGWEYWFWHAASFGADGEKETGDELTGSRYDPNNVTRGIFIETSAIAEAFHPSSTAADWQTRDFDNDGLTDLEELNLGTNPTHWDTDGDGICDGWEWRRDLNPLDPRDGSTAAYGNPDGDHMAYALVPRQLVAVVLSDGVTTNMVLGIGAEVADTNGNFTALYNYGTDNDLMAVGLPYAMPAGATVATVVQTNALLLHFQVASEFGFDPRTAWASSVNRWPKYDRFPSWAANTPNTKPFTSLDEYRLLKFMSELRLDGATASMPPTAEAWERYSTHPLTPDTDITKDGGDGMPDGWELYVAVAPRTDLTVENNRGFRISPWNHLDGAWDHPVDNSRDQLVNRREFAGTDSSAAYTNEAFYNMTNRLGSFIGEVSITFQASDRPWINKFWPSNPWVTDTDGDGLNDLAERTFIYGKPGDSLTLCTQGGGLNPNSVDTDRDGLPDKWEAEFAGTAPDGDGPFSGVVITNGMDGTVKDHDRDWDFDGLRNYQEYWVQSVRGFRYDIPDEGFAGGPSGNTGLPIDSSFVVSDLWQEVTNVWDVAKYPLGDKQPNFWFLPPIGYSKVYASTDPREHDTDLDNMDDYYELFHGLNPILGHGNLANGMDDRLRRSYLRNGAPTIDWTYNDWYTNSVTMDFVQYPWLAGMPECDPDADGLLNLEEKLQVDMAAPANYNTDPSPMWLTDYSSPLSLTSRFYYFGGSMFFWPGDASTVSRMAARNLSMFAFEQNEGYDTDNDGVSDKVELMQSSNISSSPQDHDDPVRRQALWFDGVQSAAQTVANDQRGEWALRSFTVELWACPETVQTTNGQVLIERPILYEPADASDPNGRVRRN